jgi:hypothetical protein
MKRTSATRIAAKWTAWASRFEFRFQRYAGAYGMALLLHLRGSRTSVMIAERLLSPVLQFCPQFHWSFAGSPCLRASKVFAEQVNLLTHARLVMEAGARPETVVVRSATSRTVSSVWTRTLMGAVDTARRNFSTLLERRFVERRDSLSTQTSERLVHRSNRVEQLGVVERTMTLRRDHAAAMKSGVESIALANSRTPEDPRRTLPQIQPTRPTMPAINVDQLADHVIRQIDRRIIARRERMGRI